MHLSIWSPFMVLVVYQYNIHAMHVASIHFRIACLYHAERGGNLAIFMSLCLCQRRGGTLAIFMTLCLYQRGMEILL